jgi:predicted  nucleic acid-binding Zn-ribbon protein
VASITTIFKNEPEQQPQDTDKLVDLFRNRAELKKEFAALRNEKYQLQDRIKAHQGATERVQQKLNHLESLLLDPDWVHNVVVFYQLRRLAAHCEAKIERFAEQLKQQREQRVYNKALVSWNEELKQSAEEVQAKIGEQRLRVQMLEDQLQSKRHKLMTMGGISKLLRGRSQASQVENLQASIVAAQAREQTLLHELSCVETRNPPAHQGLDISAKRSINFMILAFAQQLYLDYVDDNLVGLAKESSEKSVGAVNYGSKFECDQLLQQLISRREEVEQAGDFAALLKTRAKMIAKTASFRNDDDAVPIPGTVETIFDIDPNGVVHQSDARLLGENYFGIAKILSR